MLTYIEEVSGYNKTASPLFLKPEPKYWVVKSINISSNYSISTTKTWSGKVSHFLSVFLTAEVIIALCLNIALFVTIICRKKLWKQYSVKFFLNLQVVHIALAIFIITNVFRQDDIKVYIMNGLLIEMFLCLVMYTIDRLIAIKYPYKYEAVSDGKVTLINILVWIPAPIFTPLAIVFEVTNYWMSIISSSLIVFAAIVLMSSNAFVYAIAKRHFIDIQKHCRPAKDRGSNEKKVLKSTYVCICIVLSFLISWFPLFVHNVLYLSKGRSGISNDVTQIVEIVALLNSALDPLLFSLFRKDVKKELKKLLKRGRSNISTVTFSNNTSTIETSGRQADAIEN